MTANLVSIIVPAYNEADAISGFLDCVAENAAGFDHEVLVVDNLSTDKTAELAEAHGGTRVINAAGTVAAVRNAGAASARGDVYIFLDADVQLTDCWQKEIGAVIAEVRKNTLLVTGSWVRTPVDASWIEKYWFAPLDVGSETHINSAHFIINRKLFDELKGFNDSLMSGEDFDISQRARNLGATVVDDKKLKVIHLGYPRTAWQFFLREVWHGMGDFSNFKAFLRSRPAILGVYTVVALIISVVWLTIGRNWLFAAACLLSVAVLALAASAKKYRNSGLYYIATNAGLYFVYFLGRGLSPVGARLAKLSWLRRK